MGKKNTCCICGTARGNKIQLKNGYICPVCLKNFPPSIREQVEDLTVQRLLSLKPICKKAYQIPKIVCFNLGLTDKTVQINGFEYPISNLESFATLFHPTKMHEMEGYSYGYISARIVLKTPHIAIEEKISEQDVVCKYTISGTFATYSLSPDLFKIATIISEAIRTEEYDVKDIRESLFSFGTKDEKDDEGEDEKSKRFWKKNKKEQKEDESLQPIKRARILFGFSDTCIYTKDELIKRRNQIMTVNNLHPDDGGDAEQFKEFIKAYKLLLKFAKE